MQIRVSSVISNSPIIMNVDCDMYSNNKDTIRDALCFFLDEEMGHKIGFVQYPQSYNNMTKNDTYGNSMLVISKVIIIKLHFQCHSHVFYNMENHYACTGTNISTQSKGGAAWFR
jgi:hypothetical protein